MLSINLTDNFVNVICLFCFYFFYVSNQKILFLSFFFFRFMVFAFLRERLIILKLKSHVQLNNLICVCFLFGQ